MAWGNGASWRRDTRPGVLVIMFGIAVVGFAALWAMLLLAPALISIDHSVSAAIRSTASPQLDPIAVAFTTLGGFAIMAALAVAVAAWLLWRGLRAEAALVVGTMTFGPALGQLIKLIAGRARPPVEFARIVPPTDLSFPSGHALAAFLFFGTLVFLLFAVDESLSLKAKALVSAVCVVLAIIISMSRVYLGVHYLGDVFGGWLLGAAVMTITVGIYVTVTSGRTSS
jgi:undecaprenyl-diphosphatase